MATTARSPRPRAGHAPPGPDDPRSREPALLNDVAAALPDFALAATFLVTWIAPTTFSPQGVKHLVAVMLLEFVVIHSAAFMGMAAIGGLGRWKASTTVLGFAAFYSLFAGAFSLAFRSWWPILAFWGLVLNRLLGILLGRPPEGHEKEAIRAGWAVGAGAYLFGAFATIFLPLPRLGITPAVVSAQEFTATGLWIEQPHRALAFGVVYFGILGLWELRGRRAHARTLAGRPVPP